MFPHKSLPWLLVAVFLVFLASHRTVVRADGPADNQPDNVRRIPELGIDVPAAEASVLEAKLAEFKGVLVRIPIELKGKPSLAELTPDVEVFYKAVHDALTYHEIYNIREISAAQNL